MRRIILFLLFSSIIGTLVAQTDTEFWFAVPEVTWRHVDPEPTYLHFAAVGVAATVTIDMPKNSTFAPTTFTIPANGTKLVDLTWYVRTGYGIPPFDILTTVPNNGTHDDNNIMEMGLVGNEGSIENRGVHITSTSLITVYLERNATNNPDIWALKGKNAVGDDFYVPSQNFWNNHSFSAPEALNAIDIVATEDTWVYFAPTAAVKNIGPGAADHSKVYSRYLLKGQSISLVASDEAAGAHLGGTHVWSDGKIVVSWKDDSVQSKLGGCYDLMGDQMIPNELAGDEYIVMRGELTNNREYVFVMSLSDGTVVDLADSDGFAPASITLGAPGSISRILLNNKNGSVNDPVPPNPNGVIDALHLKSHNGEDFLVFHVTGFGCEMGSAVVPTIRGCTGSTEVDFQRSTGESFFLNIMCKAAHINDFTITIGGVGYAIPSSWFTEIPLTGWWYLDKSHNEFTNANGAIPAVPTGQVTKVTNSTGLFHLGLINGGSSSGCRYGYFSDFSNNYGEALIAASGSDYIKYCYQDTIVLQSSGGINYLWDYTSTPYLSNTFVDAQTIATTRVNPPPGFHTYDVTITRSCYLGSDQDTTITVAAYGYPEITAAFDTVNIGPDCCSPFEIKYINNSTGANKYEWTFERVYDTLHNIIKEPEVVYFTNSYYAAKDVKTTLKVSYSNNCPDTISKLIPVKPIITAKGSTAAKSGCQQDVTKTYYADTTKAGPITSILWDWGDGGFDEILESDLGSYGVDSFAIDHTHENLTNFDTTYIVTLSFIDSVNDCSKDTLFYVMVPGVARARFTVDKDKGCSPLSVNFENASNGIVSYLWDFGNGVTSSSGADTTIIYSNTTNALKQYFVDLTIDKLNIDGNHCYDTYQDTITVYPEFTTTITTADPLQGCNPLSVDFAQTTVPNVATQFFWDFGNGATSGLANPLPKQFSHFNDFDTDYEVTLIAKSDYNCVDTAIPVTVTSYAYVDALFTVDDTLGCSPFEPTIENITSDYSYKDFTWTIPATNLGDLANDIAPFTLRYINSGIAPEQKTIILTNQNTHAGCEVSYSKTITVNPEITAQFTKPANTDTVCNNTSITFTNESFFTGTPATKITAATGTANFYWTFGDGTSSSNENPTKLFKNTTGTAGSTPQKFVITLTLTVNGCTAIYKDSVYVNPVVKAQLSTPSTSLCNNTAISIANSSIGADTYLWQFSDGVTADITRNVTTSVNYTPVNTQLNNIEQFKVYLTASNGNGCSHTDSITLSIYPTIVPAIGPDVVSGCGPLTVNFTNITTGGNATDNPLTYLWDFGDGQTSSLATSPVSHKFANQTPNDLPRTITLTATNSIGCSDATTQGITIFPEVDARFTFLKASECAPNVFFDNNSLNGTLYQWDFGFNGETLDTTARDFYKLFEHTNPNPNLPSVYTIQMTAYDENHPQCSDDTTRSITIYPPVVPQFVVSAGDTVCYPEITEFTNSSTGYDLSYIWDYRDGNTSAATAAVHTHLYENRTSADITYPVKLTVIDGNGCSNTDTKDVVAHPRVIAGFAFEKDADDKCTPIPVHFSYPAWALNGNQFEWDFDDGTAVQTFTNKNPFTHIFDNSAPNTPASYSINLVATDVNTGCTHDTSRTIRVFPRLVPKFTPDILKGCNPLEVEFVNETTGMASYSWDFADNQTSIKTSPFHKFVNLKLQDQDYNVVLTASQDSTGCVLTADTLITVYSFVDAVFGLQAAEQEGAKSDSKAAIVGGCTAFDVVVTDSSKVNGTKLWDFGANFSIPDSSVTRFELTYLNNDNVAPLEDTTYIIKLTLTNTHGCKDETQQSVAVYPRPVANFTGNLQGCQPLTVNITNESEANDTYSYFWELSDGSTLVNKDFMHTFYNYNYENPKIFTVTLTASSENECTASYTNQVTVYPKPLAVIVPQIDRNCPPFDVVLENQSQGTDLTYYWNFDNGSGELQTLSKDNQTMRLTNFTAANKTYNMQLRTVSQFNCSDTTKQPIIVYPEVRAKFAMDVDEGCSPVEINFTNTSEPVSTDGATVFEWDFGDGITSENKQVTHRYVNESGDDLQYVVNLYAASVHGCDSAITDTVTIYISPNAEFAVLDPIKQYPDTVFQFKNLSKTGPWDYLWDYGDGHTSTETSRDWHKHVYTGWGDKTNRFMDTVRFTVYSDHCSDESYQLITRRPPMPSISIENEQIKGCVPLEVDFNINSAYGYEESIEWNFGDGDIANEPEPYHVYDTAGVFFIRVEIEGDGGLFIDTAFVEVYPLPVPQFSITPTYVMLGNDQEVQFYNTSYVNLSNSSLYYDWDFGDGGASEEKSPSHLYTVQNLDGYQIKLVVTSDKGCVDSLIHPQLVQVDGSGKIDFPNAFLPVDGKFDGSYGGLSNDVFRPAHYGVKEYELWIFNRWGEQVFYSDDIMVGWNGRYGNDGNLMEQDVYFWKSKGKFNNGVPFKKAGDVTLIRR